MFNPTNQDYSASEWSQTQYTVSSWRRVNYRQVTGRMNCLRHRMFKLRWGKIFTFAIAGLMLMFVWKNIPVLLVKKEKCAPCENDENEPEIVLDYEYEIDDRKISITQGINDVTTIGPPPKVPDAIYVANLTEPRKKMEFSIIPWKVIEDLREPIGGKECFHMNPIKRYDRLWGLIIFVKSTSTNFDRRKAVRETWGRVYFLNQIQIEKIFVVGQVDDPAVQKNLQLESDTFGDILQFEGADDYRNMPIKVTAAMQWASENLPADYFYASSDDDFVVNFVYLIDFLEYQVKKHRYYQPKTPKNVIRENLPIYCVYYLDNIKGPNRENISKWYVTKEEYSLERYPPYCGGGFYMMPVAMAKDLYTMSRVTKILPMDDVWVTGILRQKLRRGDENVVKAKWPRKDDTPLWKHLWGDYGPKKKDIAKLLPSAWKDWDEKILVRPHCKRTVDPRKAAEIIEV